MGLKLNLKVYLRSKYWSLAGHESAGSNFQEAISKIPIGEKFDNYFTIRPKEIVAETEHSDFKLSSGS
jgi:hypothetical protein